jgi:hypothetical protein
MNGTAGFDVVETQDERQVRMSKEAAAREMMNALKAEVERRQAAREDRAWDEAEAAIAQREAKAVLALSKEIGPAALTSSAQRKATPIYSGVMAYFPLALAAIARLSKAGNDKHNPGQSLHWSRGKSNDHLDCVARHLIDAGGIDEETGELHDVALAWRALANLQLAEERRLSQNRPD